MESYVFCGVILPERAQLSRQYALEFFHQGSGAPGKMKVSILNNQLFVWVETDREWDICDLRNVVNTIVQGDLAVIGYLKGYAYDLEVTRVLNPKREVDYVFGIEIPCIEERGRSIDLDKSVLELQKKTEGVNGVFVSRCLNDLISAMKHANDTAFYCYRAIESLRHHCAALNGLSAASRLKQLEKFRQVSGTPEKDIRFIKEAADPLRHGQVSNITSSQRAELFKLTWDVVGAYLEAI